MLGRVYRARCVLGPWGIGLVSDTGVIEDVAAIGIMFLLYLIGLTFPRNNCGSTR